MSSLDPMNAYKILNVQLQCGQLKAKILCPNNIKAVTYFWQEKSPNWNGKSNELQYFVCVAGDEGKRGKFGSSFSLKYSFHAVIFGGPLKNYFGPQIFCHSPVAL